MRYRPFLLNFFVSCLARLDLARRQLGIAPRRLHIARTRQRHAHAAPGKALGLAKQAQVGAGHAQGFFHAVEHDACGLHAAVDDGAGAGVAQAGVHRQAEDGAGVQLKFALVLRAQRDQAGVVRAWVL